MSATAVSPTLREVFAPPKVPGFAPSAAMALVVHALLLAALTLSVQWKHQTDTPAIEAEMWSATALQAAAKAIEPPPAPPEPLPEPVKTPPPVKVAPPPTPSLRDAQIAVERQKAKDKALAEEQQIRELTERKRKDELKKRELEKQALEDKQKRDKLEAEKKSAEKEKAKKREADAKLAADKEAARAKAEADARYKAQMDRVMGMAGASGDAKATGTALKSSAPSAGYAGRISGRVKPNIVFADDLPGNPEALVEFRTAPDGTIVGTPKLLKSSGVKAWDEAVINAILKTEVIPRDTDGRVPPVIQMGFKPKDGK